MDANELAPILDGHDCVLSALGVAEFVFKEITFCYDSIQSIVAAMNQVKIKRLICVTTFYTKRNLKRNKISSKILKDL